MTGLLRSFILSLVAIALAVPLSARAGNARAKTATVQHQNDSEPVFLAQRGKKRKKRRKKKRRKRRKNKNKKKVTLDTLDPAKQPAEKSTEKAPSVQEPPAAPDAPVFDLTNLGGGEASETDRDALLGTGEEEPVNKDEGGVVFDLGGGSLDVSFDMGDAGFGLEEFDIGQLSLESEESKRFDAAMAKMTSEAYEEAVQEFRFFLEDSAYADFHPESEYQLSKALYKLNLLDASLTWFRRILEKGPQHPRYRKAVEWLFFMTRKMADETPVLAELARFRNVKFPQAYQDEYRYNLAKYLFLQAERFEVERLKLEELNRNKKAKSAELDFGSMDFSEGAFGGDVDFGLADAVSSGGGGGFDFGSSGGGSAGGAGGGGFDFGSGGAGGGGGGFDFGGSGDDGGGTAPGEPVPTRTAAPQTALEAIELGLGLLSEIDGASKFGPKAAYLKGLMHYLQGDPQTAVGNFQETVRALNPRSGGRLNPALREQAFLSLARIHYGHKQFLQSASYYDKIDRDSENWLTSLFEASWAYYRRGDYDKALGNLLTLHSPFFEREYFPESQIVKAIIYFEACRYAETRQFVDDFLERFSKVMGEIQRIAESKESSEQLYQRLKTLEELSRQQQDDVTSRVVSLALNDPGIRRAKAVVQQAEAQLAIVDEMSPEFKNGVLGRELRDQVEALVLKRIRETGEVTRKKFEEELYALKSLLAQALRIKIEVARAERTIIEKKMQGQSTLEEDIVPAQAQIVVDDDHLYWPYEGEFWRDELGTYELDFSMCRALASR